MHSQSVDLTHFEHFAVHHLEAVQEDPAGAGQFEEVIWRLSQQRHWECLSLARQDYSKGTDFNCSKKSQPTHT